MFDNQALREAQTVDGFRLAHEAFRAFFVEHIATGLPDPVDPGAASTTDNAGATTIITVGERNGLLHVLFPG